MVDLEGVFTAIDITKASVHGIHVLQDIIPKRNNQKGAKNYPYIFRKARKRIETQLSQLCDQFTIRTNFAKTFEGFKTRILSKITAMTVIQFINKFINQKPVYHLKNAIC